MKTCTKCKKTRPLRMFGPHKLTKDGLHTQCRVCHAAYVRQLYAKRKAAAA